MKIFSHIPFDLNRWDKNRKRQAPCTDLVWFTDQLTFLGNFPPNPPLTHVSALKSQVSEKHGLGVEWVLCSFPETLTDPYLHSFGQNILSFENNLF